MGLAFTCNSLFEVIKFKIKNEYYILRLKGHGLAVSIFVKDRIDLMSLKNDDSFYLSLLYLMSSSRIYFCCYREHEDTH